MIDPVITAAACVFLALLFGAAAWHKLSDRPAFTAAVSAYDLLPAVLVPIVAGLLPLLESVVAGACLLAVLLPTLAPVAAGAAVCLLAVYTAAIGINLARGRFDVDCGCSGPGGGRRLGLSLVLRNGVVLLVAGMVVAAGSATPVGMPGVLLALVAGTVAWLLYAAADELAAAQQEALDL